MVFSMIGISAEAEQVYGELIDGKPVTVADLVVRTRLPKLVVHTALVSLESSRLVERVPGSPPAYLAKDPAIALDVLLLAHEHEVKRARIAARDLAEHYRLAIGSRDPAGLVEVVSGKDAIMDRLLQIYGVARKELRGFDKPPYVASPEVAPTAEIEYGLLARGLSARVIYERAALELPGRMANLESGMAFGEQIRFLPELPTKLVIVDDSIAILPLQSAPEALESAVVVHESGLLRAVSALFEALWATAIPLGSPDSAEPAGPDGPTEEERGILMAMSTGIPDDVIARELGISERTYQRRVQAMMRRLHAQTRFQLARQACLRGWLADGLPPAVGGLPGARAGHLRHPGVLRGRALGHLQ